MPAMTNPEDYPWYGLKPPEPYKKAEMNFHHIIPQGEESFHLQDRCCECEPYIDPDDITVMHHISIKDFGLDPCCL